MQVASKKLTIFFINIQQARLAYFKNLSSCTLAQVTRVFDSLIISPSRNDPKSTHITFIESRYSIEKSSTVENIDLYKSKYAIVQDTVKRLQRALEKNKPSKKDHSYRELGQSPIKELLAFFVFLLLSSGKKSPRDETGTVGRGMSSRIRLQ